MSDINDGGPAFAAGAANESAGWTQEGMSLRDWFAGQALAGMLSGETGDNGYWEPWEASARSYKMADSMIAARNGEGR